MPDWLGDPQHLKTLIGIVTIIVLTLVISGWWKRYQRESYIEAVHRYDENQDANYEAARGLHAKARKALQKDGAMVVDLVHDMKFNFFSERDFVPQEVTFDQAMTVLDQLRQTRKGQTVKIVLHTLGGSSLAVELIAAAIKAHSGPTHAIVPYVAMSGGTMIALAADRIHLGKSACLGPVDTQYYAFPFSAYRELFALKREKMNDETLLRYYNAALREGENGQGALARIGRIAKKYGEGIIEALAGPHKAHDHRITADEAKDIGLRVDSDVDKAAYDYVSSLLVMLKRFEQRSYRSDPESVAAMPAKALAGRRRR